MYLIYQENEIHKLWQTDTSFHWQLETIGEWDNWNKASLVQSMTINFKLNNSLNDVKKVKYLIKSPDDFLIGDKDITKKVKFLMNEHLIGIRLNDPVTGWKFHF